MNTAKLQTADDDLRKAHASLAERERLEKVRAVLAPDVLAAERELAPLDAAASREQRDVERYQSGAWAFVYDVFADRDARLAKERKEAAVALAKATECRALRDRLAAELTALDARLAALQGAEAALTAARARKEAALRESQHPSAVELEHLSARVLEHDARAVELDQALSAGLRAHDTLAKLVEALNSASRYSTADLWMDSAFVSMAKRSRMDSARALGGVAQAELQVFQRELGDLGQGLEGQLTQLANHQRFLDVWFDNIFSDWSVAKKLEAARQQTAAVQQAVTVRLQQLRAERAQVAEQLQALAQRRVQLLD